jgi:hypothetical protein
MRYAFDHRLEVRQKGENAYNKALGFSVDIIGAKAKNLIFGS